MKWLKHAFAVDPPGPAEPTPEQKPAVDRVCAEVVRRHLTTPALLFLESARPLNYLGAQALHFFTPIISVLTSSKGPSHFAAFLEKRGAIDYLCRTIEDLEEEAIRREKAPEKPSPDSANGSVLQTDKGVQTDNGVQTNTGVQSDTGVQTDTGVQSDPPAGANGESDGPTVADRANE